MPMIVIDSSHPGVVESQRLREEPALTKAKVLAVTALLCCLTPTINLKGQADGGVVQKIKQLQQDNLNAQLKNDASWMARHLADGYQQGNSWGAWQTKDDVLKSMRDNKLKWNSGEISDVHVATFGPNVAVSHYTFTYDAEMNGTHRARTILCSDTWINDSGAWKTAASHCSFVKGM
jgi:hypothetical protein